MYVDYNKIILWRTLNTHPQLVTKWVNFTFTLHKSFELLTEWAG